MTTNAEWLNKVPYHTETIECPECHSIEQAEVRHTEPFYMYAHICSKCEYPITESEWCRVNEGGSND